MFKNYLNITLRNLSKYKAYSIINITGLAIGMTSCILILLYIQNELNYDSHHEKADRIYRVTSEIDFGGEYAHRAAVPPPVAETLVRDYPEVVAAARFRTVGSFLIRKDEPNQQNYKEDRVVFADNAIFDIFTIPMQSGDPKSALLEPKSLVISQATALKYFGETNPIGKSLILDNHNDFIITGVFEDMPQTSHFHFDFIASLETLSESKRKSWTGNNFKTYILLAEGADPEALEEKFPLMLEKYFGPHVKKFLGMSIEELLKKGNKLNYHLQPLRDIHLHSNLRSEFEPNSRIKYIYIFSAIALFILIIACINFMNLSTARSANRAKEVGVRKVMGSYKNQLIWQFLTESILLSWVALFLALGLVELLLPQFNQLAGKQLETSYFSNWAFLTGLFAFTFLVGILAGSYPAFVLSAFKPINVLKGKLQGSAKMGGFRGGLVVFQFIASVILIAGTLIIKDQLYYIQNKKLGFDKEQVVIVHDAYALGTNLQAFKTETERNPEIIKGTISGFLPVSNSSRNDMEFWPEGRFSEETAVAMQLWSVDYDYIETFGMEIIQGRDFSRQFGADSSGLILNEMAAKNLGFDNPIGKRVSTFVLDRQEGIDKDNLETFIVIGVVKNFHFESLRENIGALAMKLGRSPGFISFRFKAEDVATLLAFLDDKWREFGPEQPFSYTFLNERFNQMYRNEQRVGDIFTAFSALAIFTACLGLFGLASFAAEQRRKEIGIRKVLGATVANVVALLSKDFIKLVLLANLFAWPVAWYAMNRWLQNFAYRIEISWWIFALAGGLALLIALLTVSTQAVRAAVANPVESLRYE